MPKRIVRRERPEPTEDERPEPEPEPEEQPRGRRAARRIPRATREYDPDEAPDEGGDEGSDDDDEDIKAERAARRQKSVRTGWGGYKQTRAASSDFPDNLETGKEAKLIKIAEPEPFASFRQHWIERPGKKSWTCGEDDCPICDTGDRPASKTCFNVYELEDDAWTNKVWTVGNQIADTLQNFATDPKTNKEWPGYFSVKKVGKGKGKTQTVVTPVKERDVLDDWGVDPLGPEDFEELEKGLYDDSTVQVHTKKQLREIASELMDEDED